MEWINKESVLRICEAESEDVAAIISKVKRLPIKRTSEQISVSDRLPEAGERVLATDGAFAEEVVRCKDCDVPHNRWIGCRYLNGLIPPPDFYCAYGKRKNDKDEKR